MKNEVWCRAEIKKWQLNLSSATRGQFSDLTSLFTSMNPLSRKDVGHSPPEMLNLLIPDSFSLCKEKVYQIILSGYSIRGYLASGYFSRFTVAKL